MTKISRSSVLFISICFAFFACARSTSPPSISNEAEEKTPRIPTFADNLAATVSVYCVWQDQDDNETVWDIEAGIVLDAIHVLATRCNEDAILTFTIGPFDPKNESGEGLWKARQVAGDCCENDLAIFATDAPMPLPSVVISAKTPEIGEILYTITPSYADDISLSSFDLLTAVPPNERVPWSDKKDFAALMPYGISSRPTGVFNQRHEFVGFIMSSNHSFVTIPLKAPSKFKGNLPWGFGYDIAATSKTLKPLLRKVGIALPNLP